jgi:hypothetical protein
MRILRIFILIFISTCSWGQPFTTETDRYLTYRQNEEWLKTTHSLSKSGQWTLIKQRFFTSKNNSSPSDSIRYSPLIVISGVPFDFPDKLNEKDIENILDLLNEESINKIAIVDKFSETWIFCNPFSGVILLTVDKRTYKRLSKLKFE